MSLPALWLTLPAKLCYRVGLKRYGVNVYVCDLMMILTAV